MADNEGIIGIIIGIGIGFFAALILIKREQLPLTSQQSLQQTETQRKRGFMGNPLANWKPLKGIPNVDAIADGREQFQQLPIIPIGLPPSDAQIKTQIKTQIDAAEPGTSHTYKNSEKWKIVRNENNRIVGYELDRKADISE